MTVGFFLMMRIHCGMGDSDYGSWLLPQAPLPPAPKKKKKKAEKLQNSAHFVTVIPVSTEDKHKLPAGMCGCS